METLHRRKGERGTGSWDGALFQSLVLFLNGAPRANCERKARETRNEPSSLSAAIASQPGKETRGERPEEAGRQQTP